MTRLNPKYLALKQSVLKRDKYRCRWPGCNKRCSRRNLECHHIIPWSMSIILRYDVHNCITLCKNCHKKIKGKELIYAEMFRTILGKKC